MLNPAESKKLRALGLAVIETEAKAVAALSGRVDENFARACAYFLACEGRIVVIGMGKSGHIGGKIAATLASTGSPAFFVHPGEAGHGDLGMITPKDVVLALSNSGETAEILTILPLIKRLCAPLVSMTGNARSTLARAAEVNIDVSVEKEACPLGLAPTASTTAALAMGDALAVALLESRGFSADDFALSHPGGSLGRRLLLRVEDIMHSGNEMPAVGIGDTLKQALLEMTRKGFGITAVLDAAGNIAGVFTDGDLRRTLDAGHDVRSVGIAEVMTQGGKCIRRDALAVDALSLMQQHKISALLVLDQEKRLAGVLHMLDLLRAGVV